MTNAATGLGDTVLVQTRSLGDSSDAAASTAFVAAAIASGGGTAFQYKSTSFTAVSQNNYLVDTSGGALTVTLPAAPNVGDVIQLADPTNSWNLNNVTLNGNGKNIASSSSSLTLNISGSLVSLKYISVAIGWQVSQ